MKCATLAPTHEFITVSTIGLDGGDIFINPAFSSAEMSTSLLMASLIYHRGPAPQPGPSPALLEGNTGHPADGNEM